MTNSPPGPGFYRNANSMSESSFQVLCEGIAKKRGGYGLGPGHPSGAGSGLPSSMSGHRRKSVGDLLEEQHNHEMQDEVQKHFISYHLLSLCLCTSEQEYHFESLFSFCWL